ncbi:glycosyltransferase family 39 protein [Pseudarthrobacter sp. H3Y2-7]|uniref:ArnT family glycosyltransferase n=1 Tax=Pseudarthrobacter naphthalenicus TaxID=3031328 RepID=UPI0023B003E4|nr:glycosyltransferase family 39 protein [Pseudarthrobacter sp. H3Y2-7]MDE8667814.1 glycosyltransferase family 39 protein [Pseudarthrobacter sp. H3Y2-7]
MTAIAPSRPQQKMTVWGLAIASFLPSKVRPVARQWMRHLPLGLILLLQAVASLRLSNTIYRDEGLYVWTGYRVIENWLHGTPLYDDPSRYFSGAPALYPVIASLVDRVGGLELVRIFSLLWMLAATAALHAVAKRLFHSEAAFWTALSFAVASPTMFLGHFATFDAMALSLLALAMAAGARGVQTGRFVWAPVVGLLLTVAVVSKYAALMFVPVVLAVIWLSSVRRWRSMRFAVAGGLTTAAILAALALTVGSTELEGLAKTTIDRHVITYATWQDIAQMTVNSIWPYLVVGPIAAGYLAVKLRRPLLALVLLGAMLAPAVYQAYIGESVSLEKHLGFGLLFGSLAIGALLSARIAHPARRLVSVVVIGVMGIAGLAESHRLYGEWSNSDKLADVMAYSWEATPYMRTLGDVAEPLRYRFMHDTEYWQWTTTDSIYYNGQRGMEGAEAGLRDRYWQYVYFDGTTKESRELMPRMESFGYALTKTITLRRNDGTDTYYVWENYEPERGAAASER